MYSQLPPFYVVVVFLDVDDSSFFIGGKPNNKFVRIVSQHLARDRTSPEDTARVILFSFTDASLTMRRRLCTLTGHSSWHLT